MKLRILTIESERMKSKSKTTFDTLPLSSSIESRENKLIRMNRMNNLNRNFDCYRRITFIFNIFLIIYFILMTCNQDQLISSTSQLSRLVSCSPISPSSGKEDHIINIEQLKQLQQQHQQHQTKTPDMEDGKWKDVLKNWTEKNPCGSKENFTICAQCGDLTLSEVAFYFCCLNSDGVREFCINFLNYDLDDQQTIKQDKSSSSSFVAS